MDSDDAGASDDAGTLASSLGSAGCTGAIRSARTGRGAAHEGAGSKESRGHMGVDGAPREKIKAGVASML